MEQRDWMHVRANKDTERDDDGGKNDGGKTEAQATTTNVPTGPEKREVGGPKNPEDVKYETKKKSEAYALSSSSTTLSSGILAMLAPR